MNIFALYGKDDGLYSPSQVNEAEKLIGKTNLAYYDHCSHSVFNDQQSEFLLAINNWLKK
jgi:proline iminopeptidase